MASADTRPKQASDKAIKYATDLMRERDWFAMYDSMPSKWQNVFDKVQHRPQRPPNAPCDHYFIAQSDVSTIIEQLKKCPRLSMGEVLNVEFKRQDRCEAAREEIKNPTRRAIEVEGIYRKDNTIYKVQRAVNGSGRLYAKRLTIKDGDAPTKGGHVKATFIYAPGAVNRLTIGDKLSLDAAREYGALYGSCVACGRLLTNELSIALGIGPVCGEREFGGEFTILLKDKRKEYGL